MCRCRFYSIHYRESRKEAFFHLRLQYRRTQYRIGSVGHARRAMGEPDAVFSWQCRMREGSESAVNANHIFYSLTSGWWTVAGGMVAGACHAVPENPGNIKVSIDGQFQRL